MILLAGECDADGLLITGDEPMSIEDMAWRLRCDAKSILEDLKKIQKIGLMDFDDGCWLVCKFRDRQGRPQSEKRELWRDRQNKRRGVTGDTPVTHPPREEENRQEEIRQEEIKEEEVVDSFSDPSETVTDPEEKSHDPFDEMVDLLTTTIGLLPTPADFDGIQELVKVGITEGDIRAALHWRSSNARPAAKTISQLIPGIITSRNIRVQKNGGKAAIGKGAEGHKGSDFATSEYAKYYSQDDEAEYDDDTPEVDTKWQTFVQQHVKDRRWQNLLEYGGYDDSGNVIIHVPEAAIAEAKDRFGSTLSRYFMGGVVLEGVAI